MNIRTFLWRNLARDEPESSGGRETSLLVHLTTPSRTLSRRRGASSSSGRGRTLKDRLDVVRSREKELKGGNIHFVVGTSPNNFRFDKPAIYSRTRLRRQVFCVVKLTVFILVVSYLPVGRIDFQAWTKKLRSQNSRGKAWEVVKNLFRKGQSKQPLDNDLIQRKWSMHESCWISI